MADTNPKEISQAEAIDIIMDRKPLGMFWLKEGKFYVGIDNGTGDAWTEAFATKDHCFEWLLHKTEL